MNKMIIYKSIAFLAKIKFLSIMKSLRKNCLLSILHSFNRLLWLYLLLLFKQSLCVLYFQWAPGEVSPVSVSLPFSLTNLPCKKEEPIKRCFTARGEPTTLVSSWTLYEKQDLRPQPRLAESDLIFYKNPQIILLHTEVWKGWSWMMKRMKAQMILEQQRFEMYRSYMHYFFFPVNIQSALLSPGFPSIVTTNCGCRGLSAFFYPHPMICLLMFRGGGKKNINVRKKYQLIASNWITWPELYALFYAILHKRLDHLQIAVSTEVFEAISHG